MKESDQTGEEVNSTEQQTEDLNAAVEHEDTEKVVSENQENMINSEKNESEIENTVSEEMTEETQPESDPNGTPVVTEDGGPSEGRKEEDMRTSTSNIEDTINFMLDDDDNMLDEEMIYEDGTTNRSSQVSYQTFHYGQ